MKTNIKISERCAYMLLMLLLLISCTTRSDPGTPSDILATEQPTNNNNNNNNGNNGNENDTPEEPGKTFEVIDPITGNGLGESCNSASDCLQGGQNHNPQTGNVEGGASPICFDTTDEIPSRELKSVNITLDLCVYGNEALVITNNIMQIIHYSTGKGEYSNAVHGEDDDDPYMYFYEFPSLNSGPNCPMDATVTRTDEPNALAWLKPTFIPYNLNLNIDTVCTTSITSFSFTSSDEDFEVLLAEPISNRNSYQTWIFKIEHKEAKRHKPTNIQISFTYEYMERL